MSDYRMIWKWKTTDYCLHDKQLFCIDYINWIVLQHLIRRLYAQIRTNEVSSVQAVVFVLIRFAFVDRPEASIDIPPPFCCHCVMICGSCSVDSSIQFYSHIFHFHIHCSAVSRARCNNNFIETHLIQKLSLAVWANERFRMYTRANGILDRR